VKRELRFRPQARRDLRDIWRYSQKTWSSTQADRYLAKLNAAINALREKPETARASDEISPGLLRRDAERHLIYFRVKADHILIIRVLHQRMDHAAQLANDEG